MPRWEAQRWVEAYGSEPAALLRLVCCPSLFWTWRHTDLAEREIYEHFEYHPSLVAAAREAAAPLGSSFGALHVRRGDKLLDPPSRRLFHKMTPQYYLRLMKDEGFERGGTVFVATDELQRSWFAPLEAAYTLRFVSDLAQAPLLDALSAFPQPMWVDVLSILEQLVCIHASGGFVGTLPSTLSGLVVNARQIAAAASHTAGNPAASTTKPPPPLFRKLRSSCCDPRTALDLLRLPGVRELADVPCYPPEGHPSC